MTDEFVEFDDDTKKDNELDVISFSLDVDAKYKVPTKPVEVKEKITYMKDKRPIKYDEQTEEYYRVLRLTKQDPVSHIQIDPTTGFKFEDEWDPYTGERLGKDPHGPLWFDPDLLIKHFYTKRLHKLWVEPTDDDNGYFSGSYDDAMGTGSDLTINKKPHPEWYLFRLPIIDCYLTKGHMRQVITFGPKLTDAEIKEIDRRSSLKGESYRYSFAHHRPSLTLMKTIYDQAINKTPLIENAASLTYDELCVARSRYNMVAIDKLKAMRG